MMQIHIIIWLFHIFSKRNMNKLSKNLQLQLNRIRLVVLFIITEDLPILIIISLIQQKVILTSLSNLIIMILLSILIVVIYLLSLKTSKQLFQIIILQPNYSLTSHDFGMRKVQPLKFKRCLILNIMILDYQKNQLRCFKRQQSAQIVSWEVFIIQDKFFID